MRFFLLFLSIFLSLLKGEELKENSKTIEEKPLLVEQIDSLEKGIKRDFYINEYLKTSEVSSEDAYNTLSKIDYMNAPLFYNFAKKFQNDETLAVMQCMQAPIKELIYSYADCIKIGLDTKKLSLLSTYDLKLVLQNLQDKYPDFSKKVKVISSAIPFTKLITSDINTFYELFLNVSQEFRQKYFNYKIPSRTLERVKVNNELYNRFIQTIILDSKLTNLEQNLETINLEELNEETKFLLTLYYINKNDLNKAYETINLIKATTSFLYKEKLNFFKYYITKDASFLEDITTMEKLNIYSFYQNELLENRYTQQQLLTLEFIDKNEQISNEEKAFIYAVIKTKSDFKDDFISSNFDLGLTQLNIDLLKKLQDVEKKDSLITQLEAQTNIEYFQKYISSIKMPEDSVIELYLKVYGDKFDFSKDINSFVKLEYLNFLNKDLDSFLVNYFIYFNKLNKDKQITTDTIFQML